MYKVFVNDYPIILTDKDNFSTKLKSENFNNEIILEIVAKFFNNELTGIYLKCEDLKNDWHQFCSNFKVVKAAGGKVLNTKNEVLLINRFGKWDLPKGKLEKGETIESCAIREVEEECGISGLQIINELETTYHIYKEKNQVILKVTYWFLMKTDVKGILIPQTEEGIETVVFKTKEQITEALKNTYENIKLLF